MSAPGWTRAQGQSLASIPVESAVQQASAPMTQGSAGLRVRVYAADAPGLARFLGLAQGHGEAAGSLDLSLKPGMHPDLASSANYLSASFVVDFDDAAVRQLRQQLVEGPGQAPVDGTRVLAFVAKSMRSSYVANASLASEVARSLQGDCTEHALLTAALARSMQIPARIVHGAALMYAEGRWQAYGHAWVQTLEDGRWIVRDSALAAAPVPVYYVPSFVMADEGPGYQLGMMLGLGRLPSRIEILDHGAGALPR
jgi:hypothetical protein